MTDDPPAQAGTACAVLGISGQYWIGMGRLAEKPSTESAPSQRRAKRSESAPARWPAETTKAKSAIVGAIRDSPVPFEWRKAAHSREFRALGGEAQRCGLGAN
jgi:hypothetical protein